MHLLRAVRAQCFDDNLAQVESGVAKYYFSVTVISSKFPQSCPVDVILIELLLPGFNVIVKSIVPQVFQDPVLVTVIVSLEPFTERSAVRCPLANA